MRKQRLHPLTAILNTKQKAKSKQERYHALQWLIQQFPEAFDNKERIRPLKAGIMTDILCHAEKAQAAGISKGKLREAVVIFTRRIDYLACLKAQEMRVDLFGNPTHAVTAEEAERAALKIKKRIEKAIKNVKKNHPSTPRMTQNTSANAQRALPPHHYPEPMNYEKPVATKRTPCITIKTTRTFDPKAVERLKEKLGLSRKESTSQET